MSQGITAVVVDPTLNTSQEVSFVDANALWDAIDTVADGNRTYHECIGPNVPQKLHFRYKITEGQKDITKNVLTAIKAAIKKIWGKKLRDEQIILTSFDKDSIKYYDIVIAGYHVSSCREAQFAAMILKKKVKQWLVIDGTVYKARAKWLIMHNYAPQTGASVKIPANPVADNQRVFNINSLVTWVKGTEALPNKSDRPFVPYVEANEADLEQKTPDHPSIGSAVDEVPEEECPEDVEVDQQDEVVNAKDAAKAAKDAVKAAKDAAKEAEKAAKEQEKAAKDAEKAAKDAEKKAKKDGLKAALLGKKGEKKEKKEVKKSEKKEETDDSKKALKKSKAGHLKTALFGKAKKRGQDDGKLDDLEEVIH